jgi:hypothetical protein
MLRYAVEGRCHWVVRDETQNVKVAELAREGNRLLIEPCGPAFDCAVADASSVLS